MNVQRSKTALRLSPLTFWLVLACCPIASAQSNTSTPRAIRQYRAAVNLQNQNMYDLATDEWQTFLKQFPHDPLFAEASHYLGVCLFQEEQYSEAEKAFSKSLDQQDGDELRPSTMLNLGLAQFNLGQDDDAALSRSVETLASLTDRFPNKPESEQANYYLAESLFATGKEEAARGRFESTLRKYPRHPQRDKLLYGLAVAQQQAKKYKAAFKTFERLLREFPKGDLAGEATVRSAEVLVETNDIDGAEKMFARIAVGDSSISDYANLRQAACRFRQKKYQDAARSYEDLVRRFPKSKYVEQAIVGAGKSHFLANNLDQSRKWLTKAIQSKNAPDLSSVHWMSRLEIKSGNPSRALKGLERTIARASNSPMLPQLMIDFADALYEIPENKSRAEEAYHQVAEQFPDNRLAPQAQYMAAFVALEEKEYDRANRHSERFLKNYRKHDLAPDVLAIQAESLLQTKKFSAAAQIWTQLVDRFPNRSDRDHWVTRIAICLNRQGHHRQVIDWLSPRIDEYRDKSARGEAEFLLGSAWLETGRTKQGIQFLNASLKTSPEGPQAQRALLLLGETDGRRPEAALTAVHQLLSMGPAGDVRNRAMVRKAELLHSLERFDEAADAYEEIARTVAGDSNRELVSQALLGRGWSLVDGTRLDQAVVVLRRLQEEFQDHSAAKSSVSRSYYALATAYQQQDEFQAAVEQVAKFVATDPDSADLADALYIQGLSFVGLKQLSKAATAFRKVLQVKPDYADADQVLYELAWAYQDDGDSEKSIRAFKELADRYPNSPLTPESEYRVAEQLYDKESYEAARHSYARALNGASAQPKIAELAMHKFAWSYFQEELFAKAEVAFQQQLERFGDGKLAETAALMLAECAFEQDHFEVALKSFERAFSKPGGGEQLRSAGLLHAGQSAAQLGRWQDAFPWLARSRKEFPDSDYKYEVECELARAYQNLDQTDKARKLYRSVADGTESVVGARARFMLGELQFAEREFEEAIRTFFKVAYGYGHPHSPAAYHVWQADAMFEAARCCESTKRFESARKLYGDLIKYFPQSPRAELARKKLAALAN